MKTGPVINTNNPMEIQPMGPNPDWAPNIDPQMLAVIEQFMAFENPKVSEISPFQFRNAKLPVEAVMALLTKTGIEASKPKVDISHKILPVGPEEGILVRIYKPVSANSQEQNLPVIVYYHGGGWVIADLNTYEPSAIALSDLTNAIVVSVAYRLGPEHVFPAAHDDSYAAYKWVVENAAELGSDPNNIATAGESAGGNLAVAVPLMAKEQGLKMPVHILAIYPIADGDVQSPTYDQYEKAVPLNRGLMKWFFNKYVPDWETKEEPLVNLIDADLSQLPPTTIINAEIDPLQYEGGELAEKLKEAGIDVKREVFSGVTHEFFGMAAVLEQAVEAQKMAAERLKESFNDK
ncbi:alpha/beta hydrolase [Salegentibacter sp. JZCK2]|uniref:alpha/beta hydrolase n=1 Tax=Salegentibacter tibetensis TaxID=2873600 RepID=UPI001CCE4103|nr:alpha/beta hydrolase [Salegentibacter tibetensis]MBZ9730699.1 alpha/beta hydrolase [Salegentibacter tibetensis]